MYVIDFWNIPSEKWKCKMLNVITEYFQYNPMNSALVMMNVTMVMTVMTMAQNCEQDL